MTPVPSRHVSSIDHLRRNREDGAYHCPKCNYPFTRRSNLRRHFVIHTRNTEYKCSICEEVLPSSDALESHLRVCSNFSWQALQGSAQCSNNYAISSSTTPSPGPSTFPYPSPISNPSPEPQSDDGSNLDLDEILASMSSASLPLLDPSMMNPPSPTSFRERIRPVTHQEGSYFDRNLIPFTPRFDHRDAGGSRRKDHDGPVYTQRQVEDMLNMVSNVFLGQMENLLQRTNPSNG